MCRSATWRRILLCRSLGSSSRPSFGKLGISEMRLPTTRQSLQLADCQQKDVTFESNGYRVFNLLRLVRLLNHPSLWRSKKHALRCRCGVGVASMHQGAETQSIVPLVGTPTVRPQVATRVDSRMLWRVKHEFVAPMWLPVMQSVRCFPEYGRGPCCNMDLHG